MSKNIIIVGAGGFGREILSHVKAAISAGSRWQIKGFMDDRSSALSGLSYQETIFCNTDEYIPAREDYLVCAIGDPNVKRQVMMKLKTKGARFLTLVHPSAIIGQNVRLGEGCVLCHNSSITCDVQFGDFVTLNGYSGCGHDSIVGSYSTLSGYCEVTGGVVLGEGVFMGSGAKIAPGKKVGDWASIGIGSVVIQNVKPGQKVFGVPAKSFN